MLPQNDAKGINQKAITTFRGVNRLPVPSDGELEDCKNMSLGGYPALQTRPLRANVANVAGKPQGIAAYWYNSATNGIAWVAGGKLFLDGEEVSDFSLGTAQNTISIADFWGCLYFFPDKKYYDYVNKTGGDIGAGTYPDDNTSCPDMDYVCVHNNRLWGVKGSVVYASSLGRARGVDDNGNGAWTYFIDVDGNPAEGGAYFVEVASSGDFSGIISWDNRVVALKDNFHHEVYGTYPSNFGVRSVSRIGTSAHNSIVEADSRLYWATPSRGVATYAGGKTDAVSRKIGSVQVISGGSDGTKYYACGHDKDEYKLFVYDATFDAWMIEDVLHVIDFANSGGYLYALVKDTDAGGRVLCLNPTMPTEDGLAWEIILPDALAADFDKQIPVTIHLKARAEEEADIIISVSLDGGSWESRGRHTFKAQQVRDIVLGKYRCNSIRVKVEGTSAATIYGVQYRTVYGGNNK